jgi:hypothetical protein
MAQPTGASYSALILPKAGTPNKTPVRSLPKAPKGKSPVAEAVKAVSSPKGLSEARTDALFAARPHPVAETVKQLSSPKGLPKAPKAKGGSSTLATIFNLPAKIETKGYANLAAATGIKPLKELGNVAAEAVNLPTQVLPAAYHLGHALAQAKQGNSHELHELGSQFLKESALAHVVKGDFGGALKAAANHPLGTALEAGGVASSVDRTLGALGRMSGADAAALAEPGADTISRSPRELIPGGATEALRPYDKGLVRKMVERKADEKPPSSAKVSAGLRKHYDRTESSLLRISRASRQDVQNVRAAAIRSGRSKIAGVDAVVPHAQFLADPSVLDKSGHPLYQQQISDMVQHLSLPRENELPHEAAIREANRDYFQRLREDPKYNANPQAAYKSTLKLAADKRALEPQLEKHGIYSKEQMRTAKVIPAFQFHFRDQLPWVEPTVKEGESPFKLGGPEGKPISVDEVYKRLEAKGVHEKQLAFTTTRPFENKNAAFRSGHTPGGAKVAKGHLTGAAFSRGLFDPTYDAAIRQHLTDRSLIDRANGDWYKASNYVQGKEAVAKLVERKIGSVPEGQRVAMEKYVKELRSGGSPYFEPQGTRSSMQRALEARETLQHLYPDSKLEPVRTVHPYATRAYTDALGKRVREDSMDKLDPSKFAPDQQHWQTQFPTSTEMEHNLEAGPVGLVPSEIAKRMKDYEKDTGKGTLARLPASFWRKTNVAFSVRHVPGVTQEIGGRALLNNIGAISHMRGSKAYDELLKYGDAHPDPAVKLGAQRLRAMGRGTVAAYTEDLARHTNPNQFGPKLGRAVEAFQAGSAHKITGAPLRAVQGAMHAFNGVTNKILSVERSAIEHPPQIAGMGKHYNNEFKAITGKRLKVVGAFKDVEKAFLRGQLDPKALDHAGNVFNEYWGDWSRASPEMKKVMSVSPFAQWYLNSLRFVYKTMPLHHPIKTALLTAIEGATAEQRAAEGQGYKGGLPLGLSLNPTDLEPSQQGSIPLGPGERIGQEFYTPQGAVSGGLESGLDAVLPYLSGTWSVLHGVDPLTNRPIEEEVNGKKQPVTDANKLATLGALSAAESFMPPLRIGKTLTEPASAEKEDSMGKSLGAPPALWKAFRPLRTEKARFEGPTKKATKINLGSSLGSGLGSKLGSSLK